MRVHALARLLGASSRDVLTALEDLGESVRSPQSTVGRNIALRVAQALLPDPAEPGDHAVAAVDVPDDDSLSPRSAPPAPLFLPPQAVAESAPAGAPTSRAAEPAPESRGEDTAEPAESAEAYQSVLVRWAEFRSREMFN